MDSNSGKALNYVLVWREKGADVILRNSVNDVIWTVIEDKEPLNIVMKAGNVVKTYSVSRKAISVLDQESVHWSSALKAVHILSLLRDNKDSIDNAQRPAQNEKLTIGEL